VYVYTGSATGLSATPVTLHGPAGSNGFGRAVACAGDTNGDGYPDVVVGAYGSQNAFVYAGSATGLQAATPVLLSVVSDGLQFGAAVAPAGDVNNDGYADVIIGAYTSLRAFVFHGSAGGTLTAPTTTLGGAASSEFGRAVVGLGDTNRDGYSDVIVGAPGTSQALVYRGSATGVLTSATTIAGTASTRFGASLD
jgi:hypothetical protein